MSATTNKVIVVDDEAPARARLVRLLDEFDDFEAVGEAAHGLEALQIYEKEGADIVLMDIRMPGMDGIEAARHLAELQKPPAVIFTTAYNEYAIDAFDARAIGYLMKPVRKEKLVTALEHASRLSGRQIEALVEDEHTSSRRTHFSARIGEKLRLIPWEEVRYFLADQKYVALGLVNEEVLIDDSLRSLEQEFAEDVFRIHRNALVVTRHLHAIEKQSDGRYKAIMKNTDNKLSISRRHLSALRKLIKGRR